MYEAIPRTNLGEGEELPFDSLAMSKSGTDTYRTRRLASIPRPDLLRILCQLRLQSAACDRMYMGGCQCFGAGNCATLSHCGWEVSLRNPVRSGCCSISDAIAASSIACCSLVVGDLWFAPKKPNERVLEVCCRITSLLPMSRGANSAVPPRSLAEQRKITVVPQFSTMVCASVSAYAPRTCAILWKPKTQRPPNFRSLARASLSPSMAPRASSSSTPRELFGAYI